MGTGNLFLDGTGLNGQSELGVRVVVVARRWDTKLCVTTDSRFARYIFADFRAGAEN